MVIDAQAIEHLEILEVPGARDYMNIREGTLYHYLTQFSSTGFGKRLMKRWLVGPLKDVKKIKERLEAVEYFVSEIGAKENLH